MGSAGMGRTKRCTLTLKELRVRDRLLRVVANERPFRRVMEGIQETRKACRTSMGRG